MRSPEPPKSRPANGGVKIGPPESLASRLDDLERTIERVRGLYEAHFLGIERRPPEVQRLELQRKVNEARKVPTSNTALKFRSDTLVQRLTVLSTYWTRTMREIELGTYRRDVFKAERRLASGAKSQPQRPPTPGSDKKP